LHEVVENEGGSLLQQGGDLLAVRPQDLLAGATNAGAAELRRRQDPPVQRHLDRPAVPQLGTLQQVVQLGPGKQTADIRDGAGLVVDVAIEVVVDEGLAVDRREQPIEGNIHAQLSRPDSPLQNGKGAARRRLLPELRVTEIRS
jgi:hypothetical protein